MRVAVIATASGSGKTTVARRLARLLGVPHVELDALFHGPGWVPEPSFVERVDEVVAGPGWVIDGNYMGQLGDRVIRAADLVVWIDIPLAVCLWRLALRTAERVLRKQELWNGNRETFRNAVLSREGLFRFAIANHSRRRRLFPERLAGLNHVRLRSGAEIESLLEELSAARAGRPRGASHAGHPGARAAPGPAGVTRPSRRAGSRR